MPNPRSNTHTNALGVVSPHRVGRVKPYTKFSLSETHFGRRPDAVVT